MHHKSLTRLIKKLLKTDVTTYQAIKLLTILRFYANIKSTSIFAQRVNCRLD